MFVLGVDSFNSLPSGTNGNRYSSYVTCCIGEARRDLSDATLAAVQGSERRVETAEQMLSSSQGRFVYCENFEFDMASSQIRKKASTRRGCDC